MELRENILFADRYRLLRLLGRGGFSEVWLASDEKTGLRVAVKVYAPGSGLDEDGVRLFTEELSIVYNLNHSNLLKPHHFDECGGCPYLVLPYCERGSAQRLIGKLTEEEAWRFLHDVSAGLEYLHAKEPPVIHQDIKPDNVLLEASGTFMITDFGISTRARSTLRRSVSHAEHSGGTMEYMGPERFGEKPAPIKASDIWSLGATLFELLTGSVPFVQLGGILQMNGALLPAIEGPWSERLKEVVKACLSKDPWDRPTAHALREYVESFWRGENPELKKTGEGGAVHSRNVSPLNFFGKRVWVGFLLLLLICGGGIVYYLSSGGPKENKILKTQFGTSEKDSVRLVRDTITLAASKKSGEERIDGHQDTIGIENSEKQKKLPVKRQTLRNGLTINWSPSVTPKQKEVLSRLVGNMVKVDGGSFQMGATPEQGKKFVGSYEEPVHKVTLSDYYMGKYEVRQSEWEAVMGSNPSSNKGNDLPVEQVSWEDCHKFIRRLNALTGLNIKLPTEAQWEYAARGGRLSKDYKYSGSNNMEEVGWCLSNSGNYTHLVGQKQPNELGLYDMSGNVQEWCEDWYEDYSSDVQVDPVATANSYYRMNRGGGWNGVAEVCCVSIRYHNRPDYRGGDIGLRLVCLVRDTFALAASKKSGEGRIDGYQDTIGIENSEKQKKPSVRRQILKNGLTINWSSSVTPKQKEVLSRLVENMVQVEGGRFQIGATSEQGSDAYNNEKPVHEVTLSDYYIGKYEVRQSEWEAVMGSSPSRFKGDDLPVESVSWSDCHEFIRRLNALTGLSFKLPTEAQWEYAARGGSLSKSYKYSGSNNLGEVGWYEDNSGNYTHRVGGKQPNELDLYDMSGNVWEWCEDWYGDYSITSQRDPLGAASGSDRVCRGGSWLIEARLCRVSFRNSYAPGVRGYSLGLRLVC